MKRNEDSPTESFERRLRDALFASIRPEGETARRVLARIGDQTPADAARERLSMSIRRMSGVAAALLAVLAIIAASLGPLPASVVTDPGLAIETPEVPSILGGEDYLDEYSSEEGVLAAVFTVEMSR
jgi:hypothetical protein